MAKDVKFNIKLSIDGKEHIITASTNVKRLAQEMEIAQTETAKLRDALLKINQVGQSIQNAFSGLQQITGLMQEYTAANAVQQEAEAKLANNMRNTMGARDEDIQSIKDLCAAQQQLGVIGDEIQLNGAQELATYLEKKSSLETLIPVMNDMIAQQYGLNATSESAANIATMLGKVMDGQVGALSRYGYTFDEAQEQVLKFGAESERAAVLAEVVSSSVGGMNEELAKTDAGKAKQAANDFGDLKEEIGALFAPLEGTIIKLGQAGLALNAIITTGNGIHGITVALKSMHMMAALTAVRTKAAALAQSLWNKQIYYGKTAMYAWTFGAKLATVQAIAMRAAILGLMAVTGVGLAIAAVAGIISMFASNVDDATDSMKESNREAKKAEEEAERLKELEDAEGQAYTYAASAINIYQKKLKDLLDQKSAGKDVSKEEKKIVGELNDAYGDTMGYFDSVSKWYEALIANSESYCRQMVLEAKTRALANQIAAKEAEIQNVKYDDKGNARMYSTQREIGTRQKKSQPLRSAYSALQNSGVNGIEYFEIPGTSDLDKANQKIKDAKEVIADLNKQMQDAVTEAANLQFSVNGSETRPGGNSGGGSKNGKQELQLVENASTYKELANNVSYYQQELEKCDVTDTERIMTLARAKKAAEDAVTAFKNLTDTANMPATSNSLDDYDRKLQQLRKERQTASRDQIAAIDNEIARIDEQRKAFELAALQESRIAQLEHAQITTRDQLNAKMAYYNTLMAQGTEADRKRAQQGIDALNEISEAWDAVISKSQFKLDATGEVDVSSLNNLKDVDAAISFYTAQQQKEDAAQIQKTQAIIDRLTARKQAIQLGFELPSMQKEVEELEALTGREYRVKIKSLGFDGLADKIRELNKLLDNPNLGDGQRKQLGELRRSYERMRMDAAYSFDTLKNGWGSIKGIGNSIQSGTDALEGKGNAWQKVRAIVDAFISLYESISAIVGIINMLTTASKVHTATKIAEGAAVGGATAAQVTEAATQEAAAIAAAPVIAANKAATASYVELAAAEYMAAHAYIPFAGFGIGSGFASGAAALVQAIGLMPFADGGIVSGPTMALIGEYAGARHNPEVVAPLDKLRSVIEPTGGINGEVVFKIRARELVGILSKENNLTKRS